MLFKLFLVCLCLVGSTGPVWAQSSEFERTAQRQRLQRLALHWRADEIPGVELWRRLTAYAVQAYPHVPQPQRSDHIMEDLALVILGPAAQRYLRWYDQITPWGKDPLVIHFLARFSMLKLPPSDAHAAWRRLGYVGKLNETQDLGLDQQWGQDFKSAFDDGTDNQIYHSFFYQYMAYLSRDPERVRWGSLYHEWVDEGRSVPDHRVALAAIELGLTWRHWREQAYPGALELWPESIALVYGRAPLWKPQPALQPLQQRIQHVLQPHKGEALRQLLEWGSIELRNGGKHRPVHTVR